MPPSRRGAEPVRPSQPPAKVETEGEKTGGEPEKGEEENWRASMMKPAVRPVAAAAQPEERRDEREDWRNRRDPPPITRPTPVEPRVEPEGNWREKAEPTAAYRPPRGEREWAGEPQKFPARPEVEDDIGRRGDIRRREDDRDEIRQWRDRRPEGTSERSGPAEPSKQEGAWRRGEGRPMAERRQPEYAEEPRGADGGGWRNQASGGAWGPSQGGQPAQRGGNG